MPAFLRNSFLQILRNGVEITDIEYAHLQSCRTKASAIDYTKTCTLSFSIANMSPRSVVSDLYAEIFALMELYIFSPDDMYTVIGGHSQDEAQVLFKGSVAGSPAMFPEDGMIGFTVTLNNQAITDPNSSQDVANPHTWPEATNVLQVMQDVAKEMGRNLVPRPSQLQQELTSFTFKNGISRSNGSSSWGFLKSLADNFSCYLDDNKDGNIYLRRVNPQEPPLALFMYRPITDTNTALTQNRIISFMPDLENPMGAMAPNVNGMDEHTGESVTASSQKPTPQKMNTSLPPGRTGGQPPASSDKSGPVGDGSIPGQPIDVFFPPRGGP